MKLTELLEEAAKEAGLPTEWASDENLHQLIGKESSGVVGRPTGMLQKQFKDKSPQELVSMMRKNLIPIYSTDSGIKGSRAMGIGQMQPAAMQKYAPNGIADYGNPKGEAIAMLRYIKDTYGNPYNAIYGNPNSPNKEMRKPYSERWGSAYKMAKGGY